MLNINNLHVSIEGKKILKGINLQIEKGKVYAIMGPNGSGKSTLASVLAGKENYEINEGEVSFNGKNLLDMPAEERAWNGVFLAFQYPIEIPGVSITNFLRAAITKKKGIFRTRTFICCRLPQTHERTQGIC